VTSFGRNLRAYPSGLGCACWSDVLGLYWSAGHIHPVLDARPLVGDWLTDHVPFWDEVADFLRLTLLVRSVVVAGGRTGDDWPGNGCAASPSDRRRVSVVAPPRRKMKRPGQTRPFRCLAREVREQVGYGLLTGPPLSMVTDDVSWQLAGISCWAGLSLS
jgi:hypothetical protein